MEYKKAAEEHTKAIFELVQKTITTIYPKYYPKEVVDFFCELHNEANIREDIKAGRVYLLEVEGGIAGTGSFRDNHITRVYVLPEMQGRGYGSFIMEKLEQEIALYHDKVEVDASLPASRLYERRGYQTIKHERWNVENGVVLVYEIMRKNMLKPEMVERSLNDIEVVK